MSHRDDGRLMCKYGHEQAGVFEENNEGITDGLTRRHTKRLKRESKSQQAKNRRMYGRNAYFLILQGMQHILKTQVTMLVQNEGAPEALVETAKILWLHYVSMLSDVNTHFPSEAQVDGVPDSTQADIAMSSPTTQQQRTSTSASMLLSQHTQSQGYDIMDDSLDFLLRKLDDDIVRDKVELLEWEQEYQPPAQKQPHRAGSSVKMTAEIYEDDANLDHDDNSNDGDNANSSGDERKAPRLGDNLGPSLAKSLEKRIEVFVRLECLPAIIYLAFVWLRVPVSLMDVQRLMVDERIPYTTVGRLVPFEISTRLGAGGMRIFDAPYPPSAARIKKIVSALETLYAKHCSLLFPLPDIPLVLLSIMRRLDLTIGIYPMVLHIIELAKICERDSGSTSDDIYLNTMAGIVIFLKMHYGLDEIERVSTQQDSTEAELDLPPLHEFLRKWRSDWTREFSIGALPYLTACGGHWVKDFASYYERVTQRSYIPSYKKEFKSFAARYRQTLEVLTASNTMNPDLASRLLPSKYACSFYSEEPGHISSSNDHHVNTPNDVQLQSSDGSSPGIALLSMSARLSKSLLSARDSRYQKWPYMGFAEPFEHYPEVKIKRGEHYAVFNPKTRHSMAGYMIPTFGLVLARCAMIIGHTQQTLMQHIAMLEKMLQKQLKTSHASH
ncbi:hypothetical protein COEREDRAFT_95166 [Coemansia reversa NRRL 1564]|uniref:Uncharacterized protein n=1 Tax=Coemansia reversa (strain ATCC 12441 / NRRL 1564) TaxID=763665 RepID=A0A2G5BKY5_COERN|nr:hypothetical protein COEREDRAFT_95166 [Coemansia reversa NRRL 1564]|eukprot:PIA19651.1 hypothetical protein COEREDRAFT_95166 [Coemansia reversa NRRL 1564]